MPKALVTGARGQLGRALLSCVPAGWEAIGLGSSELDISSLSDVERQLTNLRPDLVINAAAYTNVDAAETDVGRAWAVNGLGAQNLVRVTHAIGVRLAHVSTDFVFDGMQSEPYHVDALPNPVSVYGVTKCEGEQAVLSVAGSLVVRTSWVYSSGPGNFVTRMLHLMAERPSIRVVQDQVGSPTWASALAVAVWSLGIRESVSGVFHWTDGGSVSRYGFAKAIMEEAVALGVLPQPIEVLPISSSEYPTPARRPPRSVLDISATEALLGWSAESWRVNLRRVLHEVADA